MTDGTMEVLSFLRVVEKAGDIVAIESPAFYRNVAAYPRIFGMKALEIPTDPRDGIVIDEAASDRRQHQSVFVCLPISAIHLAIGCPTPSKKVSGRVAGAARDSTDRRRHYGIYALARSDQKRQRPVRQTGARALCWSFSRPSLQGTSSVWTAPGRFGPPIESLKFTSSPWRPSPRRQTAIRGFFLQTADTIVT